MVQSQADQFTFSSQASATFSSLGQHEADTSTISSTPSVQSRVATRASTRILQSQTNPTTKDNEAPSSSSSGGGGGGASCPTNTTTGSNITTIICNAHSSKPIVKTGDQEQKRFFQMPITQNDKNNNNHNDDSQKSNNNNNNNNVESNSDVDSTMKSFINSLFPTSEHQLETSRGLTITKAVEWRQDPEEDYKMSSPTRGYCLIINNVEFNMGIFDYRKGSDKDAHRFKEIFKQLGFEVDCKRNATAEKMKNAFKQKSTLCSSKHDALVVILLSHGSESGVYGSDGIEVELNDILNYFDNKKCKAMRGKPKIFIVQACRGRRTDYGVQHDTQTFFSQPDTQKSTGSLPSQLTQMNSQLVRIPRWAEVDKNFHPTRTDMVLCFASHSGFVSTRDEEEGSWLGASLAYHLSREAHRRHLIEIFNMVSRDVRLRRSTEGLKQVLEITLIGFDKNLYFNPGLTTVLTTSNSAVGISKSKLTQHC